MCVALQKLSVAIQQGDAASVMGSLDSEQMEIFFVSLMSIYKSKPMNY